jgi:DNA-binding SARP family transcriptional activator
MFLRKFIISVLLILSALQCFAQQKIQGGLLFSGNEHHNGFNSVKIWNRTVVYYNPDNIIEFKNNFSISFDFFSYDPLSFGPYFNAVSGNDEIKLTNINAGTDNKILIELIINSNIVITIPVLKKDLYWNNWHHFYLKFDIERNKIIIQFDKNTYEANYILPKQFQFHFSSGAIYGEECIAAAIKDFKLYNSRNEVVHHWELQEYGGTVTYDKIGHIKAKVANPIWLLKKHNEWEKVFDVSVQNQSIQFTGFEPVAYNDAEDIIIIPENNSFLYYYIQSGKLERRQNKSGFYKNNVIFFDNFNKQLLSTYRGGEGEVSVFNEMTKQWCKIETASDSEKHYYFNSMFTDPLRGDLLMLGGYGWYKYSNKLQKYNYAKKNWEVIKTKGDYFAPRYYSVIGKMPGCNKLYIFSGLGNPAGRQELGLVQLLDFYELDLADYSFKKYWGYNKKPIRYNFLPHLICNSAGNELYALGTCSNGLLDHIPEKNEHSGPLVLFKIGKNSSDFQLFNSYDNPDSTCLPIDAFYSEKTGQLFLIMVKYSGNNINYSVYKMQMPPVSGEDEEQMAASLIPFWEKYHLLSVSIFLISAGFIGVCGTIIFKRKKKSPYEISAPSSELQNINQDLPVFVNEKHSKPETVKYNIRAFGNFSIINKEGIDISANISRKLKEMFALILLNSRQNGKGITSEKLSTILWPDSDYHQQKNSRNSAIVKLRTLLKDVDGLEILFENNFWIVKSRFCDYLNAQVLANKIIGSEFKDINSLSEYLNIVKNGILLADLDYKWLDQIRAAYLQNIISYGLRIIKGDFISRDCELAVELADAILIRDSINEKALKLKINALVAMGRVSEAKIVFSNFAKEYCEITNYNFPGDYTDFFSPKFEKID